mgnify:CR=1 FL=1
MEEKIKWYEEILHLDPARLFFPLARLYAQNNDPEKAIQTLRSGLEKDPRHFEAKMFLLSLLIKQDRDIDQEEGLLEGLTAVLEQYPEVWTAWAREREKAGLGDLGVALRFVGAHLKGTDLSWSAIVQRGFQALSGQAETPQSSGGGGSSSGSHWSGLDFVTPDMSSESGPGTMLMDESEAGEAVEADLIHPDAGPVTDRDALEAAGAEGAPSPEDASGGTDDSGADDSLASYRTRTMADILAEQGDFSQALDIYVELQQRAQSQDEIDDLQAAIESMQEQIEDSAGPPETPGGEDEPSKHGHKAALVSRLERLAQRLESRSGRA